jgi:hypothetical protein
MIALILSAAVIAGVFIRWAVANDEYDAHLFHGHKDGCLECADK